MTTTTSNPFAGVRVVDPAPVSAHDAPTEKQIAFLASLLADKLGDVELADFRSTLEERGEWTKRGVSAAIDGLRLMTPKAKPAAIEPPDGFHFLDGEIFKVVVAVHGSGRKYAKKLVHVEDWSFETHGKKQATFEYVGREPFARLSDDTLLTLDKAKELGHLYGMCCVCGATLTDERSIEAGIGPVCGSRLS